MGNWVRACGTNDIEPEDLIRFDHAGRTFVVIRSADDEYFCLDGICTHEHVHLGGGMVIDDVVECPKHNACFDYRTGEVTRAPACIDLNTWPVKVEGEQVFVEI